MNLGTSGSKSLNDGNLYTGFSGLMCLSDFQKCFLGYAFSISRTFKIKFGFFNIISLFGLAFSISSILLIKSILFVKTFLRVGTVFSISKLKF